MTGPSRDLVGGLSMLAIGGFFAAYALLYLPLGSLARMGPGMYPLGAGALLAVLGLSIAAKGWLGSPGEGIALRPRAAFFVLLSLAAFGALVRPFGLAPALVVLVLIATRADGRLSWRGSGLLATGVAVAAVLIFRVALGLQFTIASWPAGL